MSKLSRRSLAKYGADSLLANAPASKVAQELASVLIKDKRTGEIELLLADINWELESRGRLAAVQITSATELPAKLKDEIASLVKKLSRVDQVIINEQIDKQVIGGVRIETAIKVWDKTVSHQLHKLRGAF